MSVHTKSWSSLRARIAKKLKIGSSRVKFTTECYKEVKDSKTRLWRTQLVNKLLGQKKLRIVPKKRRLYKVYYAKKKRLRSELAVKAQPAKAQHRFKDVHSLNYLVKRKIKTRKDLWMRKVRALRTHLKSNRTSAGTRYGALRARIKGNYYKNVQQLNKDL